MRARRQATGLDQVLPVTAVSSGFSLAEVVVATALVTVLLIPLVSACLSLQTRMDRAVSRRLSEEIGQPWGWEQRPGRVRQVGQAVQIEHSGPGVNDEAILGLWVNGWLVEERAAAEGELVILSPGNHAKGSGISELVVRARKPNGPWGSPYRLVMAGDEYSFAEVPEGQSAALVHLPQAGKFVIASSWAEEEGSGTAPTRIEVEAGTAAVSVAGCAQQWISDGGRDLDVFF